MIQRLQTIWLLIAAILAFLTLKISFFSGNILVNNVSQFQKYTAMSNVALVISTVLVGAGALVTIFLFRNRQLQMRICIVLLILSLLNIYLFYRGTQDFVAGAWSFDLTGVAALLVPVFVILAMRGIYKDKQLIRNLDRLR